MSEATELPQSRESRAFDAVDHFLKSIAALVDKCDQLSAGLQALGFAAFVPDLNSQQAVSQPSWIARREVVKESLAKRWIAASGEKRLLGYISPRLPELYESVGITKDEIARGTPARLFAALDERSTYSESRKSTTDAAIKRTNILVEIESRGALVDTGFAAIASSKRAVRLLENQLADRGYKVVKRHTMWSEQVLSRRIDQTVALEIVIPRPGPAGNEHLPRNHPMVVRPQFDADSDLPVDIKLMMNSDWITAVHLGVIVPGFLAYSSSLSWDLYARGLEAFCALFGLIEEDLIGAATIASRILSDPKI